MSTIFRPELISPKWVSDLGKFSTRYQRRAFLVIVLDTFRCWESKKDNKDGNDDGGELQLQGQTEDTTHLWITHF